MIINFYAPSVKLPKITKNQKLQPENILTNFKNDFVSFKGFFADFDREIFVKRGIINKNKNLNSFFNSIAQEIFCENSKEDKQKQKQFLFFLKQGKISLSSNAYKDLKNPQSATALVLDENKNLIDNYWYLDKFIKKGLGIGLNLSEFNNPSNYVKKLNSYFKFRSSVSSRPPAGIALLDIYNKDILNFITLKDNAAFKDWCFDLSVIIDDKFLKLVDNDSLITLSNGEKIKARTVYKTLLNSMLKKGEPGIVFSQSKDYLCDCCAAAQLKAGETLTLGQINLSKFTINTSKSDKTLNFAELKEASKILNEAMKKLDNNSYISILGYCEMLNKMNLNYGSKESIELLGKIIDAIQADNKTEKNKIKIAISPSGTISRFLKTSASIEPDKNFGAKFDSFTYFDEIDTISIVQNKIKGQISKTILLQKNASTDDIDNIIRYSKQKGLKGICVFPQSSSNNSPTFS